MGFGMSTGSSMITVEIRKVKTSRLAHIQEITMNTIIQYHPIGTVQSLYGSQVMVNGYYPMVRGLVHPSICRAEVCTAQM
jgi:hypothetical protein